MDLLPPGYLPNFFPSANCQVLLSGPICLVERLFQHRAMKQCLHVSPVAMTPAEWLWEWKSYLWLKTLLLWLNPWLWIRYSSTKCPSNCLWHRESHSYGCHTTSSLQTFWIKCPYTDHPPCCPCPPCPLISQISGKTSEQFEIMTYCLFSLKSL